jgi:hypothetical protein
MNIIIKGCFEFFTAVLRHSFSRSETNEKRPSPWQQAVTVFQKGKTFLAGNCRPISILNNFFEIFKIIMHDHLSFYFKFKLRQN